MQVLGFNTKRHYTGEGQPIGYALGDDGLYRFNDFGRGIDGVINTPCPKFLSERRSIERWLMRQYDEGKYSWDQSGIVRLIYEARDNTEFEVHQL